MPYALYLYYVEVIQLLENLVYLVKGLLWEGSRILNLARNDPR